MAADLQPLDHFDHILAPAWSPDSAWIAGYLGQQVILESMATGERLSFDTPEFSHPGGELLAWARTGYFIVTANLTEIAIWSNSDQPGLLVRRQLSCLERRG
jgi:hypothetical protein